MKSKIFLGVLLLITFMALNSNSLEVIVDATDLKYTGPRNGIADTPNAPSHQWGIRKEYKSIGEGCIERRNDYGDAPVLTTTYSDLPQGTYDVYLVFGSPNRWTIRAKMANDKNFASYYNGTEGAKFVSMGGHWTEFFWECKIGQITGTSVSVNIDDNAGARGAEVRDSWYDGLRIVSAERDTTAPTIKKIFPADGAVDVSLDVAIEINFTEMMKMGSVADIPDRDEEGRDAPGGRTDTIILKTGDRKIPLLATSDGWNAYVQPQELLQANTTYTLTVSSGVVDLADNSMTSNNEAGTYVITFSTIKDSNPPEIISINPKSEIDVPINQNFQVTFNEELREFSVITEKGIEWMLNDAVIDGDLSLSYDKRNVYFNPELPLNYGTKYTLQIKSGISDLAGNPTTKSTSKEFTTVAAPSWQKLPTVTDLADQSKYNELIAFPGTNKIESFYGCLVLGSSTFDQQVPLLAEAGIKNVKVGLLSNWRTIKPAYDTLVKSCAEEGLTLTVTVWGQGRMDLDALRDFATTYQGKVWLYTFGDEQSGPAHYISPEAYMKFFPRQVEVVREIDPEAKVANGVITDLGTAANSYIAQLFELGLADHTDFIGLQLYNPGPENEARIKAFMDYCRSFKSSLGFTCNGFGYYELPSRKAFAVRVARLLPITPRLGWQDLCYYKSIDIAAGESDSLFFKNHTFTPVYEVYKTMARLLYDTNKLVEFKNVEGLTDGVSYAAYTRDDTQLLIFLWTRGSTIVTDLTIDYELGYRFPELIDLYEVDHTRSISSWNEEDKNEKILLKDLEVGYEPVILRLLNEQAF